MSRYSSRFNQDQPASQWSQDTSASGQTLQLSNGDRNVAIHNQLYRYAEDMQLLTDRFIALEAKHHALTEFNSRMVAVSPDIHFDTTVDGVITQTNAAAKVFVDSPSQMIETRLSNWVMPDYQDACNALLLSATKSEGNSVPAQEIHFRVMANDNPSQIIVSVQVIACFAEGRVTHLHWILRDITRLRETEFELALYSSALKNSGDAVAITDIQGNILSINPSFSQRFRCHEESTVGSNMRPLISDNHDQLFFDKVWNTLKESGCWQGEVLFRNQREWLKLNAVSSKEGAPLSVIATLSDTPQKEDVLCLTPCNNKAASL